MGLLTGLIVSLFNPHLIQIFQSQVGRIVSFNLTEVSQITGTGGLDGIQVGSIRDRLLFQTTTEKRTLRCLLLMEIEVEVEEDDLILTADFNQDLVCEEVEKFSFT